MVHSRNEEVTVAAPTGVEKQFPMYVIPYKRLLEKDGFEMHETLMANEELIEWTPDCGQVVFFSQIWLSYHHPDPTGIKHRQVKRIGKRILADDFHMETHWFTEMLLGSLSIATESFKDLVENGYYWMDIEGVPQTEPISKARACNSIPWYVEQSSHFWVVVPPEQHSVTREVKDVRSWGKRGWCRTERSINALCLKPKLSVIVESDVPYIALDTDWLMNTPCNGVFTVPEDTEIVGPILQAALNERIARAKKTGNMLEYRFLKATMPDQLKGWSGYCKSAGEALPYEAWMKDFCFEGPMDEHRTGWTPLRFAMYLRRHDIARKLLDAGADIEAPLNDTYNQYGFHVKGSNILMGVSFMHEDPDSVAFLLENKADHFHQCMFPDTFPIHIAMDQGRVENTRLLLSRFPESWAIPNQFGVTPGQISLLWGKMLPEKERMLAAKDLTCLGPQVSAWGGMNYVGLAVFGAGNVDVLRAVLRADPDVNHKVNPKDMSWLTWALFKSCKLAFMTRRRPHLLSEKFANMEGATPLMLASFAGNNPCVELLLKHKASVDETNVYGRTALSIAAARGQRRIVSTLITAKANVDIRDTWGQTAADLARELGHTDISQMIGSFAGETIAKDSHLFQCCSKREDVAVEIVDDSVVEALPLP
eukprot:TRINITY_DN14044_c0_g2_i1.p1 TRINITY_DN14044_c0_g2~~TRINITY_DN14044_c0_g2_i1.p1  ORF type:complete len:650 (-),score=87.78 TRINITY_DN14044_c0_g2_i1:551-2500(-)